MANVLVVGGAGGVGSAVVDILVRRGDKVVATVLNEAEANAVRARHGDKVPTSMVDLGNSESALGALRTLVGPMARLDAVAVCAAISPFGPVETTPLAVFRRSFEINTLSHVAIYQAAVAKLRESKGRIVFISSMAGKAAMPFIGAYVASKFALESVADVMRREAGPQGVSISLIEPGGIRTGMVEEQLRANKERIAALSPEEDRLYGYLYRGFQQLAGSSHDTSASSPESVAAIVVEALDAPEPQTRYVAGEDAKQLIGLAATLPDRELDAAFRQMFGAS
jgi:NAD(P)-dependent dehydrogenase (short-subunit alcohol dehydrogenase family)